jgi:hypothetical protein
LAQLIKPTFFLFFQERILNDHSLYPILSKNFAFSKGENRLKSTASTFGCKYGTLARSKPAVFCAKSQKALVFLAKPVKKQGKIPIFCASKKMKKSRPRENFATPREKNIRPFFNKALAFSQKVLSRRNNNFYFINGVCQNFSHFLCDKFQVEQNLNLGRFSIFWATGCIFYNYLMSCKMT